MTNKGKHMKRTFLTALMICACLLSAFAAENGRTVHASALSSIAGEGVDSTIYSVADTDYALTLLPLDWNGALPTQQEQEEDGVDTILTLGVGLSWSDLRWNWWLDCLDYSGLVPASTGWFPVSLSWERIHNPLLRTGVEIGVTTSLRGDMDKGVELSFPIALTMSLTPSAGPVSFPLTLGAGVTTGFDADERNAFFGPSAHVSAGIEVWLTDHLLLGLRTRLDVSLRLLAEESRNSTIEMGYTPVTLSLGAAF